ncbi:MAG TPA: hypothetical protein VFU64_08625 [Gaiellaceae bacterium]|nr:hypothetical protein [Gaiellaceae bacterium]
MRSYGMYDASRGLTLAFAAALAGLGLWGATQVGTQTTGRFWIAMAIVGGAGLVIALANHVGTWTKGLRLRVSPSSFVIAFLPVLVCVGWILISTQPGSGWQEGRLDSWSNSIGILGLVKSIGLWHGVLAFGFGLVLGLSLDGVPAPAVEEPGPAYAAAPRGAPPRRAADEPVAAERRWTGRRREPDTTPTTPTEETETTRTRGRMPTR